MCKTLTDDMMRHVIFYAAVYIDAVLLYTQALN